LSDHHRVAVGRRAEQAGDANRAAGAAHVLDDHGLTERRPHALGNDARDDVGDAAGCERHDHGDRPRRIALRHGARDAARDGERHRNRELPHFS
jgi:hypothetical protein